MATLSKVVLQPFEEGSPSWAARHFHGTHKFPLLSAEDICLVYDLFLAIGGHRLVFPLFFPRSRGEKGKDEHHNPQMRLLPRRPSHGGTQRTPPRGPTYFQGE